MIDIYEQHRSAVDAGSLLVDFAGELVLLAPDRSLTFGRGAELDIDDNQFLHRYLGRFEHRNGQWWLDNTGSRIDLDVFDQDTKALARLTPGSVHALAGANLLVSFSAGPTRYELVVIAPTTGVVETASPSDTVGLHQLPWTHEQRLLMAVLAETLLREPNQPLRLPTNEAARTRLGWSTAKFNRKLDAVCDRMTAAGVRGLDKGIGVRNNDRRRLLAEEAIARGILGPEDLEALDNQNTS